MLEKSSISEPDFIEILKAAQIPEAKGSLLDIPDRVLQLALENWETVAALAEELHKHKTAQS